MVALSLPDALSAGILRYVVRPVLGPPFPVPVQRFWLAATAALNLAPGQLSWSKGSLGGVKTVKVEPRTAGRAGAPESPAVLYLHGGAFVTGNQRTHAALVGYLAQELSSAVHFVLYGLAPENPYPAGRKDALRAYRGLLESGVPASKIVVAGDSAGGAMVADLLLDLHHAGIAQPAGAVLLSPVLSFGAPRPPGAGRKDTLVRQGWLDMADKAYRRPVTESADQILGTDPQVLAALPPIYLQYSENELLASDCRSFVRELRAAGAAPHVQVDPGAFHVLALLTGLSKQARVSVRDIATFSRWALEHRRRVEPSQ